PVRAATVKARSRTLAELSRAKRLAFYQGQIGRTVKVLFESKDPGGLWTGLTGNYVRVGLAASSDLANAVHDVVVTGATDGLAVGRLAAC
ncbi:MAG: hypothetical protein ACREIO_06925, partial [Nitrospiraceae bacterium]